MGPWDNTKSSSVGKILIFPFPTTSNDLKYIEHKDTKTIFILRTVSHECNFMRPLYSYFSNSYHMITYKVTWKHIHNDHTFSPS